MLLDMVLLGLPSLITLRPIRPPTVALALLLYATTNTNSSAIILVTLSRLLSSA